MRATTRLSVSPRPDEIAAERRRFETLGVDYRVWSPSTLERLLRSERVLTRRYLHRWEIDICGPDPATANTALVVGAAMIAQVGALQDRLSRLVRRRVEAGYDALRQGRFGGGSFALCPAPIGKSLTAPVGT